MGVRPGWPVLIRLMSRELRRTRRFCAWDDGSVYGRGIDVACRLAWWCSGFMKTARAPTCSSTSKIFRASSEKLTTGSSTKLLGQFNPPMGRPGSRVNEGFNCNSICSKLEPKSAFGEGGYPRPGRPTRGGQAGAHLRPIRRLAIAAGEYAPPGVRSAGYTLEEYKGGA